MGPPFQAADGWRGAWVFTGKGARRIEEIPGARSGWTMNDNFSVQIFNQWETTSDAHI